MRLQVSDLWLKIVDTPGFFDGDGSAQRLANNDILKRYRKEVLKEYFPNVVLIVVSAKDDRFQEDNSDFVKGLKILKKLNLVDTEKNNAVCVITSAFKIDIR